MLEWSDLRVFLAIAREGTLGSAARQLGQTQPTMGRRLRALEAAVGQTLFQRTGEGFVLTGEGASVLGHAERVEEEVLAFQRQLAGQEAQLRGMLRLSSSDWFGTYMLTPVLAEFGSPAPICMRRAADRCAPLQPAAAGGGHGIPNQAVRRTRGHFAPADAHPIRALWLGRERKAVSRATEAGARVITMNIDFSEMPDAVWLKRLLPNATVAHRSNNREVQAQLCSFGAGLAVLPRPLGDVTPASSHCDVDEPPPGRDTFVGYHRDLRRLARMRELLSLVIEKLAN